MGELINLKDPRTRRKILRRTKQPGYKIYRHPRIHNKPLRCQAGLHTLRTLMDQNGVPQLYCIKCGAIIGKGIYERTWTKQDIRRIKESQIRKPRTNRQIMEEIWERRQMNTRERMNQSIKREVRERLRGL